MIILNVIDANMNHLNKNTFLEEKICELFWPRIMNTHEPVYK